MNGSNNKTFACACGSCCLSQFGCLHACTNAMLICKLLPYLQAVHAVSVSAVSSPTKLWSIDDLQAAILMIPGPFTTSRTVQRKVPRCHQLFAIENTPQAMKRLQARGLGIAIQTRQNQMTYHKPMSTDCSWKAHSPPAIHGQTISHASLPVPHWCLLQRSSTLCSLPHHTLFV